MRAPILLSRWSLLVSVLTASLALTACPGRPTVVDPPVGGGEGEGEGDGGEGEGDGGEGEGEGEAGGEGEADGEFPGCTVTGTAGVTFTRDEGATLAPTATTLSGTVYTYGLAALGDGNLVAEHGGRFLRSRDHGCTWTDLGATPFSPMRMSAGGGRVYAWADNNREFARIDDDDSVTVLTLGPPGVWKGLAVDDDGDVIAALDATLLRSTDGGVTFDRGTTPAFTGDDAGLVYRAFFDPKDTDHVVFGAASVGGRVSFDGGATWTPVTGLSTAPSASGQARANLFEGVISPVDGNVVWAAGIDVEATLPPNDQQNGARHIYRSGDGGLTFDVVVTASADVTIINGPMMAASPVDKDVFYFVFGTYFDNYGTDIYRVIPDGTVTKTHNGYNDISSLVFAPDDSATMYLGLVNEVIN